MVHTCLNLELRIDHTKYDKVRQIESIPSIPGVNPSSGSGSQMGDWASSQDTGAQLNALVYDENHIEHLIAHDDMRNFVHDAFSPTFDWMMGSQYPPSSGF